MWKLQHLLILLIYQTTVISEGTEVQNYVLLFSVVFWSCGWTVWRVYEEFWFCSRGLGMHTDRWTSRNSLRTEETNFQADIQVVCSSDLRQGCSMWNRLLHELPSDGLEGERPFLLSTILVHQSSGLDLIYKVCRGNIWDLQYVLKEYRTLCYAGR